MGRFVTFHRDRYINAIRESLKVAMDRVNSNVYRSLVLSLESVGLRKADRGYLRAMVSSIRYASDRTINAVMTSFYAGGDSQPNQSFRVIYYEYGTGRRMRPPASYSPVNDPYYNPARRPPAIGKPHFQRPFSSWKDMGGNWHTSRSKNPRELSERTLYGEPVNPHYWFERGLKDGLRDFDKIVLGAVKSVPITSYISIRNLEKRM